MNEHKKRRGGRIRAFDPDVVLEAAMRAFWTHGYEATSLAVLRVAMGLTSPQIYNAFTDKETLFRMALARYLEKEAAFAFKALSEPATAKQAIKKLLQGAAEAYTAPDKPGGCLFVTGALVSSQAARAIADELMRQRKASERAISDRLKKGITEGDIPRNADPVSLAKYFAGIIYGMSIQARDGATLEQLLRYVDLAMLAWPKSKRA